MQTARYVLISARWFIIPACADLRKERQSMWITIETTVTFNPNTEIDLANQFAREHPEWAQSEMTTTTVSFLDVQQFSFEREE